MKVWISVHGRFHAFDLARQLHSRGALAGVATTYPKSIAKRFLPPLTKIRSAPWLEVRRRLHGKFGIGADPQLRVAQLFGRFAAHVIPTTADIFVGWSGASLEALGVARHRGVTTVLERGSTHIARQAMLLREEYARFGIDYDPVSAEMVERELAEYEMSDAIAVPSTFAADTFVAYGVPRERLIVNPYGVDLDRFRPSVHTSDHPPKILCVGTLSLRKGTVWLLRAFARVKKMATLRLVGPVEPAFRAVLADEPQANVEISGPLRGAALHAAFTEADIFCLPSIEEGFALVVLQAMAAGLPVIATQETGGQDAISDNVNGLIVPARDIESIEAAFVHLIRDREFRVALGRSARQRVERNFSWQSYGNRAFAAYQNLLSSTRDHGAHRLSELPFDRT